MSFPLIILALALLAALDRSMTTLIIAIAVPMIPVGARIVRANALVPFLESLTIIREIR